MSVNLNTFEGGSNGANVTAAGSGGASGKAFGVVVSNNVSVGSGGSTNIIYTNAWKTRGALGCRMTLAAAQSYVRIDLTTTGGRTIGRRPLRFDTNLPTAQTVAMTLYSGATIMGRIDVDTAGKIRPYRNSTAVTAANGTVATTVGPDYWLEYAITPETGGGGNGVIEWRLLNAAGTVIDSGSATGLTIGTGTIDRVNIGGMTTASGLTYDWLDDVDAAPVASGWIGSANNAPTQVLTANQNVAAGATVTVTTTPTDDGSIASYAWTVVAGSSTGAPALYSVTPGDGITNTATVKFTAGAAGNVYVLQCVITDDGGLTNTATTEVRVPKTGAADKVPLAINGTNKTGTWTIFGGSSTDGAALADASDTTYLETGTLSATEQAIQIRDEPSLTMASGKKTLRLGVDTGTGNFALRLYEGAILRQSWTQAVTATPTDYDFPLSGATVAAISDWGAVSWQGGYTS